MLVRPERDSGAPTGSRRSRSVRANDEGLLTRSRREPGATEHLTVAYRSMTPVLVFRRDPAGARARLMSHRSQRTILLALALCACGPRPDGDSNARPNVLLVSLDSTRRDLLSCYGRIPTHAPDRATTPRIDSLAGEGVLFERAYTTTSWTLPSHMALMTGQPDLVHGVEYDDLSLHPARPLLAEVLQAEGYRTAGFYSGPYLAPEYGFGRGFETYRACYGSDLARALEAQAIAETAFESATTSAERNRLARPLAEAVLEAESRAHGDITSRTVTDAALEELAVLRMDDRPWFLFVHYFDPHYDYVPPSPHDKAFDPDYSGDMDGRDFYRNPAISVPSPLPNRPKNRVRTVTDRDLEHVIALYEGELAWTDAQLGRILDDIEAAGEMDRTLVIVLSDHGDEFFEHGNIGHRRTIFEEVVQVPLVMRYPPGLPGGTRVRGVASIVDVFATVTDLTGSSTPQDLASRSLLGSVAAHKDPTRGRALARIVDPRTVDTPDGPGQRIRIQEAFVRWPIKIRRMRQWIDPKPGVTGSSRTKMLERADEDRSLDRILAWTDLELNPGERLEAYNQDFSDPRARAALEEFQQLYMEPGGRRLGPQLAESSASDGALAGLGYGGDDAAETEDLAVDRFLLTPPGTK